MSVLPAGFEALEPFVERWALESAAVRAHRRGDSTAEERAAFFATIQPLAASALALLDVKPLADHDSTEKRLMNLCLSLAHLAPAIEAQGDDEDRHTPNRARMRITRAPSDSGPT